MFFFGERSRSSRTSVQKEARNNSCYHVPYSIVPMFFLESDRAVVGLQSKKKPETIAVTMFFTLLYLCSLLESDRVMFWLMVHVVERAHR
ncbi:MAG: hypothetical protein F6K21_21170 [Symploca sp. SIO2D2]|nr:hypothetical protein [Symploca sp. SIO2D2]